VWFLSLDAAALATVLGIRASFGLPYHWAAMTVEPGSRVTYQSSRRWPPAAGHNIVAEPRSPLSAGSWGSVTTSLPDVGGRSPGLPAAWSTFRSNISRGHCGACESTISTRTSSSLPVYRLLWGSQLRITHLASMLASVSLGGKG
jgi:hypothetical protein